MSDLRFPIGPVPASGELSSEDRTKLIDQIAAAPAEMRRAVSGLSDAQLDTPYRPEGWTVRQVVHHIADSHINSYVRFRLTLTEDRPTIKPYDEKRWAELPDARTAPVERSLALLEAVHARWVLLLRSMSAADWKRTFNHPESGIVVLERNLVIYAWHCRHHVAHVDCLRERMGWK